MGRASSQEMAAYTMYGDTVAYSITVVVKAMGVEGITTDTAGTGVRTGVKVNHPIMPIPKTVSGSSAATRTTATEVVRFYWRGWGDIWVIWEVSE